MSIFTRHPIISGVVALIVIVIIWRAMSSGGDSGPQATVYTSGGADPAMVAAGTAIQQAQLQQQGQLAALATEAQLRGAEIAGQVTIAQLGQQLGLAQTSAQQAASMASTQAQRDVALSQIAGEVSMSERAAQSANLASTLAAQVQTAGINAQIAMRQLEEASTQKQIAAMESMSLESQKTTRQAIAGQTQVQLQQVKESGGLCFITTAACQHVGADDDGYVLTVLRGWRDTWLKSNAPDEIARYYAMAPGIVTQLNTRSDAAILYVLMWHDFILPAVHCIERGQHRAAFAIYQAMTFTFNNIAMSSEVVDTGGKPESGQIIQLKKGLIT